MGNQGGMGGDEPMGGSGGTSGIGGAGTGGTAGTGGRGGAGTGGMAGTGMSADKCDYEPKATALTRRLKFEAIAIPGIPVGDLAKSGGSKDGIAEIKFIPGKPMEFWLIQKRGRVSHMKLDAESKSALLVEAFDLGMVDIAQDCGLISSAFDPDFSTNKLVYFGHCTAPKASRVVRYAWDGNAFTDGVTIMTWTGAGGPSWHGIGSMGFDPAGNMWVLHGEFTNTAQAQNMNTNLGKVMRFIPSRTAGMGGFKPAPGNPFEMDANATKSAIYSAGLRSPWRGFINAKGHYFIGDVGDTRDERVLVASAKGQNFGWGGCPGNCTTHVTRWRGADDPYDGDGDPAKEARRGRTVWVGTQYGDCGGGTDKYDGTLNGVHLFGDYFAGWFRGMTLDDAGKKVKDVNLGDLGGVSSVAQGTDGYLYVTTFGPYDSAATELPGLWRALLQ
jgi:hypothetical protein